MTKSQSRHHARNRILLGLFYLSLAVVASQAQTQAPPQFAFTITTNLATGAIWPEYLGTDSSGNLYVGGVGRVLKFANNGSFVTQWGSSGTGPGQFGYPGNFAVDQANEVYVTDPYNNRVQKFTSDGTLLARWGLYGTNAGQFDYPEGIALDSDSNVYVVDSNNARVEKFNCCGGYLSQWGSQGDNPGQLDFPQTIAIDSSNNVYVADFAITGSSTNYRVQRFTRDGVFVTQWGSYGSNNPAYSELGGMVTDLSNNVYVVDAANDKIQKYDSNGGFLAQWGTHGSGPGQFNTPFGIALDPSGNYVYVANYYNDRIEVFAYAAQAPLIYLQPASQTIPAGVNVTFTANAFGSTPLAYQWLLNGANLPTATGSALTVSNVPLSASGSVYSMQVTNMSGSALSSNATLTVVPVLATTLPVSGISSTGAVLNGTLTLGPYQTLAWFEWGTDTNYGTITGVTNLAASNTTVVLSIPLNGLSTDYLYHYRLVAWNSQGLVYGLDQSFAVGLVPFVATLQAVSIGTNSATLNGIVNPQGLDTFAFFRWGPSYANYQFSTPTQALGKAVSSLNFGSSVTGLVATAFYHYQVVASNKLGAVSGADVKFTAGPWLLANASPTPSWTALAMSADGSKLAAVTTDRVFISGDSGGRWTSNSAPGQWQAIASSADGTRLVVAPGAATGLIYVSTNSGANWRLSSAPARFWSSVASSADGLRLATVDNAGRIYTSTNAGQNWTSNNAPNQFRWAAISSSADGFKLVAAAGALSAGYVAGPIYFSTNGGLAWNPSSAPTQYWRSVASSADGSKVAAAAGGSSTAFNGPIYTSTDFGLTWKPTPAPVTNWHAIASSADGNRLAAILQTGHLIYTSADSGATWITSLLPDDNWVALASSADGSELAAASQQYIFILRNSPSPALTTSRSANNLAISWIVPSANFSLQQSSNLTSPSWADLTNVPALSLTNLHNQMILAPTNSPTFYRLKER